MSKKIVIIVVALMLVFMTIMTAGCTSKSSDEATKELTEAMKATEETEDVDAEMTEEEREPVELEVVADQPEYMSQEQEIWNIYMEENPNVTIKLISVDESTTEAFLARVASDDAPHISARAIPNIDKSNYEIYADITDIYPYWNELSYDGLSLFKDVYGVEGYIPSVTLFNTFKYSFIYHEDEMQKAGLDPKSIRTWEDVDKLLADLKVYVDNTEGLDYVLDTGWHSWCWMACLVPILSNSMGRDLQDLRDLYLGNIQWDDMEKNPVVPVFQKLKDYYDLGYLPNLWYTRDWGAEYEPGFVNKKSILTLHGPWLWAKVEGENPNAQLSGVPFPAGPNGELAAYPVSPATGSVIYAQYVDTPIFDEIVKAFTWYNSPEVAEMRSQFMGMAPNLKNYSSDYVLDHPQYSEVVQPSLEGEFGDVTWVNEPWGLDVSAQYKVDGTPFVMQDDSTVAEIAKYMEGIISIEELMDYYKERWEVAYDIN